MSDHDDRNLVRRCQGGDVEAFGRLIDRYQEPLYNTAFRMTGDEEEAKDITQTVFIKAYEKLNTYKPEHKFFSWIYRMLVNESINSLNRRKHLQGLDLNLAGSSSTPEGHFRDAELSGKIQQALIKLPFDYRMVIVLHYFNDITYKEMGDLLDLAEKTVKSRLYTARQQLAAILRKDGIFSHGGSALH